MLLKTEMHMTGVSLDALSPHEVVARMLAGQLAAIACIGDVAAPIDAAAQAMAATVRAGGSLVYAAAGSSGLMALADACELSGTFGISPDAVRVFMAGGVPADGRMSGEVEDDPLAAEIAISNIAAGDCVIVLSASGTTPYALAVCARATEKGAVVIGIANNPDTALLELAEIAICLATPPEVVAGSTRLGAGTAQKAALNIMSTLMGIALGHVYQGMMVNVVADNAKLVARSVGIVTHIAGVSDDVAREAISAAKGSVKSAILIAKGQTLAQAQAALAAHDGHLGPCFE